MIYSSKPSVECPWKDSYGLCNKLYSCCLIIPLLLHLDRIAAILTSQGGFFRFFTMLKKGPLHHKDQSPIGGGVVVFLTQGFEAQTVLEVRLLPGPSWLSESLCVYTSKFFDDIYLSASLNGHIFSHLKFCLAYECLSRQFAKLPGTLWPISSTILAWKFVVGNFWTSSCCRNE